jgi:aspartyl-tRNA(Asn)/glutamyl-tRNA(Gln) amidotransferase subunit A
MSYDSISEAGAALRAGEVTSVGLTEAAFAAADAYNDVLGVLLRRLDETALEAADKADAELAAGIDRGPLHGIPLGIKDILATIEAPATAQSLVLDPAWSHQLTDAPVVARLRAAGSVLVGKTTTNEFAIGHPDPAKPFPIPRNPWNPAYSPGGSSAGAGAGVPAGMFLGGLGTDTGGSVRMPAAFCGISGLKATFGRVPKSGCAPLAYTLDGIGPMARTARDCALMLSVMAGLDLSDPYCADEPVDDYTNALTGDLTGLRIGIDRTSWSAGVLDPAFPALYEAAIAVLESAGATVVPVELPLYNDLVTAQWVTMAAESAAYHRPDLGDRWFDYGVGARNYFAAGATYSAMDYIQAQRIRRFGQEAVAELFADVDVVVDPASTMPAWVIADVDPVRPMGVSGLHMQYWNAVGNPSLSVPIGFNGDGMPMAMQLNGRPFEESTVLRAGDAYQQRTDWHLRRPPLEKLSTIDVSGFGSLIPPYEASVNEAEIAAIRHFLDACGISSPEQRELHGIAEAAATNRSNAALLYRVEGARYAEPALSWAARGR